MFFRPDIWFQPKVKSIPSVFHWALDWTITYLPILIFCTRTPQIKVTYYGLLSTGQVQLDWLVRSVILDLINCCNIFFSLFQLEARTTFYKNKNVGHIQFPFRKYFFEKIRLKFGTILFPYKKCVTEKRKCVNKGCNLLNPTF